MTKEEARKQIDELLYNIVRALPKDDAAVVLTELTRLLENRGNYTELPKIRPLNAPFDRGNYVS